MLNIIKKLLKKDAKDYNPNPQGAYSGADTKQSYDPNANTNGDVNPGKDRVVESARYPGVNNGAEADIHNFKNQEVKDFMGAAGDIDVVNRKEPKKGNAEADKYVRDLANY